jgi:hypothetical protein
MQVLSECAVVGRQVLGSVAPSDHSSARGCLYLFHEAIGQSFWLPGCPHRLHPCQSGTLQHIFDLVRAAKSAVDQQTNRSPPLHFFLTKQIQNKQILSSLVGTNKTLYVETRARLELLLLGAVTIHEDGRERGLQALQAAREVLRPHYQAGPTRSSLSTKPRVGQAVRRVSGARANAARPSPRRPRPFRHRYDA